MNSPPLIAFISTVTVCQQTTLLQQALRQWSKVDQELLVVVDQAHLPVGGIQVSQWLPYWCAHPSEGVHQVSLLMLNPPLTEIFPSVLEPITSVPRDLELCHFLEQLYQANPLVPCHYALVNSEGQFLGLLDRKRVLQYSLEQGCPCPLVMAVNEGSLGCNQRSLSKVNISESPVSPPVESERFQVQILLDRISDLVNEIRKKDRVLAYISHALKTPITGILGLSNLLKNQPASPLSPRQQQYGNLIHQGGRKLRMMIDDVVNWTQLELGEVKLNRSPVEMGRVCDRTLASFQDLAQDFSPMPVLKISQDPTVTAAIADEFWLRYMVNRLLSYHLWTSREYKTHLLRDRQDNPTSLELKIQSQGSFWVSLRILNPHLKTPVNLTPWLPVSRPSSPTNSVSWELGLVVVGRLAQLHGGDLMCSTTEEDGSDFTLVLPSQLLPPEPDLELGNSFPEKLTILCLSVGKPQLGNYQEWVRGCHALKGKDCRLLEADDLEQAALLAKVWHPHVLVFNDAGTDDIRSDLHYLSQAEALRDLPLVTLSQSTTAIANQIPGLSVYPCLVSPDSELAISTLLQVIRIAANSASQW